MFLGALFMIDNIKMLQNKYQFQNSISNNSAFIVSGRTGKLPCYKFFLFNEKGPAMLN